MATSLLRWKISTVFAVIRASTSVADLDGDQLGATQGTSEAQGEQRAVAATEQGVVTGLEQLPDHLRGQGQTGDVSRSVDFDLLWARAT